LDKNKCPKTGKAKGLSKKGVFFAHVDKSEKTQNNLAA